VLDKLNARLVYLLLAGAAIMGFGLSFVVVTDVVGRAFFNSPLKGTPEIVSMSIVIICYLLAAYAIQSRSMIYTDVFVSLFGWRGQVWTTFWSGLLGGAFFGLVMWGTWDPLVHAWTTGEYEGEGALRVPTWPARVAILFGAGLVMLNYFAQAIGALISFVTGVAPAKTDEQAQLL
jgi:C4-dicarboxylate transporter, DctQ subunit